MKSCGYIDVSFLDGHLIDAIFDDRFFYLSTIILKHFCIPLRKVTGVSSQGGVAGACAGRGRRPAIQTRARAPALRGPLGDTVTPAYLATTGSDLLDVCVSIPKFTANSSSPS